LVLMSRDFINRNLLRSQIPENFYNICVERENRDSD
jgi:hypothetical protein